MSDLTLVIGNKRYSSWSLRGWLTVKLTGQGFEEIVIPLRQAETRAEILKYSPAGKVPALIHGDLIVWDSLAIAEYLAEAFPDAGLWPADAAARARARCVAAEMHSGFAALRGHMPMDVLARLPGKGREPEVLADADRIMAIWRGCRETFGQYDGFLFGAPGAADAFYAPVVSRFVSYGVKLDPVSQAYCDHVMGWPLMRAWIAAAEAEPWVIEFN